MTTISSQINPVYIDANFPVPGQDNDTQTFRTNFATIKTSLYTAKTEIENILANVAKIGDASISPQFHPNVPATSSSVGTAGNIKFTSSYFYVCVSANTWVRTSLTTW